MANRIMFTLEKKEKFLAMLRKWPNVSRAARLVGVSRRTAYDHIDPDHSSYDPDFAAAWTDAIEEGLDRQEEEMDRRAFQGYMEPVYYKGEVVGKVRKFSDTLAIFLSKAYRPEKFREHSSVDLTSGGEPIVPLVITRRDDSAN